MKKILFPLLIVSAIIIANTVSLKAQRSGDNPKNVASLNLFSLGFQNISLKYERGLTPWMSARINGGFMIKHSYSFLDDALADSSGGRDINSDFVKTGMSGWHVMPEILFYPGKKGATKGFYIGLYGKVDKYKFEMPVDVGDGYEYKGVASVGRVGGGMIMGCQWLIKDKVSIDWYFLGLGYNSNTLAVKVEKNGVWDITDEAVEDIESSFTDLPVVGSKIKAEKDVNSIKVSVPFSMPAFRFGLSVGYAF
jgi:hypothetical protein